MDGGVEFPSLTAAGRYVAATDDRSYRTCAVGIAGALGGGGEAYGHTWERAAEQQPREPSAEADALVRRLNGACVEVMRLSAARRTDCMRSKAGCMGIGWCDAAWALAGAAGCGGSAERPGER